MRATVLHAPGQITLDEVATPHVERPTDALVQVVAGCICGSDLWGYRGTNGPFEPRTIGHECIGVVMEVGWDVRLFQPGDRVVVPFCHSDTTCPACRHGVHSACTHLGFTVTGQAEFARVNHADGSLVRVEEEFTPANRASLLALSDVLPTGWHAAVSAGVSAGSTAVVVGDGAVGLCGVLAARVLGAERIVVLSRNPARQAVARRAGEWDSSGCPTGSRSTSACSSTRTSRCAAVWHRSGPTFLTCSNACSVVSSTRVRSSTRPYRSSGWPRATERWTNAPRSRSCSSPESTSPEPSSAESSSSGCLGA